MVCCELVFRAWHFLVHSSLKCTAMLSAVAQWCHHCQISGAVKSLEVHSSCGCHVYFIGFLSPPSRPIQNTSVVPKGINTALVSRCQCLSCNICCLCCAKTLEGSGLSFQAKCYCFSEKKSYMIQLKINQKATVLLMHHWLA